MKFEGEVITATWLLGVDADSLTGARLFGLRVWKGRSEMMWMSRIGKGEVPWSPGSLAGMVCRRCTFLALLGGIVTLISTSCTQRRMYHFVQSGKAPSRVKRGNAPRNVWGSKSSVTWFHQTTTNASLAKECPEKDGGGDTRGGYIVILYVKFQPIGITAVYGINNGGFFLCLVAINAVNFENI